MKKDREEILHGKKILIVDDDPVFCDFAEAALTRNGASVSIRRDGADALAFFEQKTCDLAVIDLIMPRVDGLRLIAILRRMPNTRNLPIVVVTSRKDYIAQAEAKRNDVELFLNKPIQWTKFVRQIGGLLEETRATVASQLHVSQHP